MSETTQRMPLTALEWLRVTHADTLSGRRIEEAVAAARADERQRWTTAVDDEVKQHWLVNTGWNIAFQIGSWVCNCGEHAGTGSYGFTEHIASALRTRANALTREATAGPVDPVASLQDFLR